MTVYGTTKLTVFVYMLPSDATTTGTGHLLDQRIDQVRMCSNGKVYSLADYLYRNTAILMGNESQYWSGNPGTRRLTTLTHTYTNQYTFGTKSLYAMWKYRSSQNLAWWEGKTAVQQLSAVASELAGASGAGWSNIEFWNYEVILGAAPHDNACGQAYVSSKGGSLAFPLGIANVWCRGLDREGNVKIFSATYGCAGTGDTAALHEITHILGGDHVTNHDTDLMYDDGSGAGNAFTFISSPHIQVDRGSVNYRVTAYTDDWTTSGYSAQAEPGVFNKKCTLT